MTTRETAEIIMESPMWESMSAGEKLDALTYAIEHVEGQTDDSDDFPDINDIIGEVFRA